MRKDELGMCYVELDAEQAKGVCIDLIDACISFTFHPYPRDRVVLGIKDERGAIDFLEKLL